MEDQGRSREPWHILLALLAGSLLWFWGMHTVWIQHAVAGLAVLGLDYLTYIKILPAEDFAGWHRAAFIWSLPLVASSTLTSQLAWAHGRLRNGSAGFQWISRLALTLVSSYTAIQILPLDWSPSNLWISPNRVQTLSFLLCAGLIMVAPLTGPWLLRRGRWWLPVVATGCFPAVALGHFVYLPYFAHLYRQELAPGPGPLFVIAASVLVLTVSFFLHAQSRSDRSYGP